MGGLEGRGGSGGAGCPVSVAHPLVGWAGFAMACVMLAWSSAAALPAYQKTVIVIAAVALAMAAIDMALFAVHRRATTGLDWSRFRPDAGRIGRKVLGLAGCLLVLAAAFWLFPEYGGSFYAPLKQALAWAAPVMIALALCYIAAIDGFMREPEDGYASFGRLLLGGWRGADWFRLRALARAWAVKGFFIPLMFVYLAGNLETWPQLVRKDWSANIIAFTELAWAFLFTLDLLIAMVGYIFALRLFDSHDRSNEPTLLGWVVALICYQPVWGLIQTGYLRYGDDFTWVQAFGPLPVVQVAWGLGITILVGIYAWATWSFGMRFSNLSNRGVITCGPYRWTKHPAYIAKNTTWWMISMPFLPHMSGPEALRQSLLLLMVNLIYFARAWTEERHMARDPAYRQYQDWIAAHGLFRRIPIPWPRVSVGDLPQPGENPPLARSTGS